VFGHEVKRCCRHPRPRDRRRGPWQASPSLVFPAIRIFRRCPLRLASG
jgi:hypothetical protein